MELQSSVLQRAVDEFSSLPGIGKRTALRLVLYLLREKNNKIKNFTTVLSNLSNEIKFCSTCFYITNQDICNICLNPKRNHDLICVVEDIRDVLSIENTRQYFGVYHVLGGKLSPIDGIGPKDLKIDQLVERIKNNQSKELILALSTTMEGDTTNFYIYKKVQFLDIKITTISRGVAIGDTLEYTDEITLGRSILNRTPYQFNLNSE